MKTINLNVFRATSTDEVSLNQLSKAEKKRLSELIVLVMNHISKNKNKKQLNNPFIVTCLIFLFVILAMLVIQRNLELPNETETCQADKCGPDYALATAGATVKATPNTEQYPRVAAVFGSYRLPTTILKSEQNGPDVALRVWNSPGECWAFVGGKGTLVINLSHGIIPFAITIEHLSKSLSPTGNINSAPREFVAYAVDQDEVEEPLKILLGEFQYADNGISIQTFHFKMKDNYPVRVVELQFLNNHGNKHYSCIYKIRVHGQLV